MTAPRTVIAALADALHDPAGKAVLALVVDTEGSTYAHSGAMALFDGNAQVGWLSGGCLEPEIARHARDAAAEGVLRWMDIDTRDDEDLLSGSAVGCRGRLHLALWPLARAGDLLPLAQAWLRGAGPLQLTLHTDGRIDARVGDLAAQWQRPTQGTTAATAVYRLSIAPPPRVLVMGGGPESPLLLPLLRNLGWRVVLVERRPRWRDQAMWADESWDLTPTQAAARVEASDAVLVMHHHFELDREALVALAERPPAYLGLLGPTRRRDDLFRVMPAATREALRSSLRSPVGLPLGGQGPEAIALSIAAQLQTHRHGRDT